MYLQIKLDENIKKENILLRIGDQVISIYPKGGKWFTNIWVNSKEDFNILEGDKDSIKLELTCEKVYHPDQVVFDNKYQIQKHELLDGETHFSMMGNISNPDYLLVTFPGVSNFDNVNHRLSALTSVQNKISKNTMILAFQDKECVYGNYMYKNNSGAFIKPVVISLIEGVCKKFGIPKEKIIFYGNSKGGSIAIDYIEHFSESYFYIDIPQMDLFNYESQNDILRYSLGTEARRYYYYIDYFPKLNNKKVFYSFAENDFDASRGLPMKEYKNIACSMLKDMGHSNAAMEFVKKQFAKIFQIVNGVAVNDRPPIKCVAYLRNDLLYINRFLSAFDSEEACKNIYAEINFVNEEDNIYSVSLNRKFVDGKTFVYWRRGFDFKKHLSFGIYDLYLTIYYNYREIKYPLNLKFICKDDSKLI